MGAPTRLKIIEFLASCPGTLYIAEDGEILAAEGPTAGEVCSHVAGGDKINSTISDHLHELRDAGLVRIERSGKHMLCTLDRAAIADLIEYLEPFALGRQIARF